jgi:hypothetical protein
MTELKKHQSHKRPFESLFLVPTKAMAHQWKMHPTKKQIELSRKYATKEEVELGKRLDKEFNCELEYDRAAAQKREAFAVESNSLVKRGESPTASFQQINDEKREALRTKLKARRADKCRSQAEIDGLVNEKLASIKKSFDSSLHTCPEPISLASRQVTPLSVYLQQSPRKGDIANNEKTCVRMYHQAWSNKYRIGLENGALGAKVAPPVLTGDRITSELTKNATRAILESGAYLSAARNGYTTFLTLTFDKKARADLDKKVAVSGNKTKRYTHRYRALNPHTGRMKNFKESYQIECYEGVPAEYNTDLNENIKSHSSGNPANGVFTPISWEPKTTIGKEVSRFFDAAQKMYQRGWHSHLTEIEKEYPWGMVRGCVSEETKQEPKLMYCPEFVNKRNATGEVQDFTFNDELEHYNNRKHTDSAYIEKEAFWGFQEKGAPLDYMWVAEQPENDKGEKNPHVHVMMRWQVEREYFQSWAIRLESLWKHGFAKLEKIKTPQAASNYLLKAVGYLTKGGNSEQGDILGNRYGISASARAPKWECIGEFYADNFIAILGELREKLNRKKAKCRSLINVKINDVKAQKAKIATLKNIDKKTPTEKRQIAIEKIRKSLIESDEQIKQMTEYSHQLPFINEFAVGAMSEEQASKFLHFAMQERFWNAEVKENRYSKWAELKENTAQALKHYRAYYREFQWIIEIKELSWQWAENDSYFQPVTEINNVMIDENGHEWELVA